MMDIVEKLNEVIERNKDRVFCTGELNVYEMAKDCMNEIIRLRGIKNEEMTANEYQELASRTMNYELTTEDQQYHALHGMVGEIGEIHSIFQKVYQGHELDQEHIKKELGDLLWFIAEFCTVGGVTLEEIMQMNIDKLKARYPEGFKEENSLNRKKGDI